MDLPESEEFKRLLQGYLRESLNPKELDLFFEMAARPENAGLLADSFRQDLESGVPDLSSNIQKEEAWKKLHDKLEKNPRPVVQMRTALRWVAILVLLLGAATAVYLFRQPKNGPDTANILAATKTPAWLKADHVGATLILSGGDSVALDNQDKGTIATEDGIQILQSGGVISYSGKSNKPLFNETRTGRGKIWRVILPDQSVVWLNGNSSIKYPLQFSADKRSVEMKGEVYFEVVHNAARPFLVQITSNVNPGRPGTTIEDLGTKFNVRSLAKDSLTTATLVEGSVRVSSNGQQATLNPGQQSVVGSGTHEIDIVQHANIARALAWKNGVFYFQNANITEVMNQLSEWYQAGVVYKGRQGKELFSGQIDKSLSLSDVLQGLQQPGVKFTLNGNQVTVIWE